VPRTVGETAFESFNQVVFVKSCHYVGFYFAVNPSCFTQKPSSSGIKYVFSKSLASNMLLAKV